MLILFSDVLGRAEPLTEDAFCYLLPPAAPVETVLMHGEFDCYDPVTIPHVIRCHERYMVQNILGVDRWGRLNYFGDPQVKKLRFDFVFLEATVSADPAVGDEPAQGRMFRKWPAPCPVQLRIVPTPAVAEDGGPPTSRKPEPMTAESVARSCRIVHAPDERLPIMHAILPPGGFIAGAVLPVTVDARSKSEWAHDIGQRIHLLHVSNGAWLRPKWIDLREHPAPCRNQSSHRLDGAFEVDAATTGGYTLAGYWNECWDEAQSLGWEEATIRYPDRDLSALTSIPVPEKSRGYGYGSEAVILLTPVGTPAAEDLPVLEPVIKNHSIERIDIRSHGTGWTRQWGIRVLRRPPLFRIATAEVRRESGVNGPLLKDEIKITDPGGWYTRAPFVVFSDRAGNGYGAKARAILNGSGGVDHVCIDSPGATIPTTSPFSSTRTSGCTGAARRVDRSDRGESQRPGGSLALLRRRHESARRILSQLCCRATLNILKRRKPTAPAMRRWANAPINVRSMVLRDSVAVPLDITATAPPSPPNIAFPLLAFHWTYDDGSHEPTADPLNYFRGLKKGTLTLTRTEAIRVYLRRPWNQSGAETLGVVIYPAIANSIRLAGNLDEADGGVVNRSDHYPPVPGQTHPLAGDVIPGPFRDIVSRWGYDPIWNERALPPLGLQHFPHAINDVAYEALNTSPTEVTNLARLAVHAVHYDPVKNLWYSNVVVDMQDLGQPIGAHPFIRLNLVAHQKHGLPGLQSSAIVATDPIPLTGKRSLRVSRSQADQFEFVFSGNFAPIQ